MKRLSMAALLALALLISHSMRGQTPDLIVPGAGSVGTWETAFQFTNGAASEITVRLGAARVPIASGTSCPPSACIGAVDLTIPANGFASATVGDAIRGAPPGPTMFYITLLAGPAVPTVSARMFNSAQTSQSFEIPVIRTDALTALNPDVLNFPGGIASNRGARSNLVVSVYGGDATFIVEVFTPLGASRGTYTFGPIPSNLTLTFYRVCDSFFPQPPGGEVLVPVRVTKLSGHGLIWGYLATVDDNGGATATAGVNR